MRNILISGILVLALTGCADKNEATPVEESKTGVIGKPIGETLEELQKQEEVSKEPVAESVVAPQPESQVSNTLPEDSPEVAARFRHVEEQRRKGEGWLENGPETASWSQFDPESRISRYPLFTDLHCEFNSRVEIFCAYGRMGEIADTELAKYVPFMLNEDVVAAQEDLLCTESVCINKVGQLIGAIQPAMFDWMLKHCTVHAPGSYSC